MPDSYDVDFTVSRRPEIARENSTLGAAEARKIASDALVPPMDEIFKSIRIIAARGGTRATFSDGWVFNSIVRTKAMNNLAFLGYHVSFHNSIDEFDSTYLDISWE